MINLNIDQNCICRKYNNSQSMCENEYTIAEEGKKVKLKTTKGQVVAIALDGCLISDNDTKCDGLFLYETDNKKYSFLVELKGFGEIEKAFYQLSYVRDMRKVYKNIIDEFESVDNKKVHQKFVIVSNGILSKPKRERLENKYNIIIREILYSEPTKPIPDLKECI
jgi:hypothetical protein